MCRITMRMKAMQRGNAIGKDLGGIIAIALADVPPKWRWQNFPAVFSCKQNKKKFFQKKFIVHMMRHQVPNLTIYIYFFNEI